MHQPDTNKRFSVFYDYQVFPFVRPPELDGTGERRPVVIVGAGPVGLTAALLLAKAGVASVVVEADAQVTHGSRAAAFTRRSMEILQQAGADRPFVENGYGWTSGRSFYRGHEVFRMEMPHDENDRFLPVVNNSQQYWEEYLVDAVNDSDLIDLRWQTKFVSLSDDANGVAITLDTPVGEYRIEADWLIACDGGRSDIRRFLGLRMEGVGYSGKFVIVDFKAPDLDFATERLCYYDPEWNPGNNVLVHRQPNDIWRFDYRLPDGEAPEDALRPETITERTNLIMKMIGKEVDWELDWATVYSPNTKTLPSYRHGRVLFAGDAAHLLPIFGIRGANTGMQDAENLAWKLALVIKGQADETLLDSYSDERVRSAFEICEEAGKSTRMMDPPTRGYRIMRNVVLSFSLTEEFCRELMHWRTSRPHEYHYSALNAANDDNEAFEGGIPSGAVARNVKLSDDDFLFDRFRFTHQLLIFSQGKGNGTLAPDLGNLSHRPHIRVIAIGGGIKGADVTILDNVDHFRKKYGIEEEGMYLLRPDMHVCGRWKEISLDKINAAMASNIAPGVQV